ncbi:MAG: hypothetical protein ACI4TB_08380 [Lachnospiraceae bacterium]
MSFRAAFDDIEFNRERQLARKLVKGRFQGGNLGWIMEEDMELFACMCRKPLDNPTFAQSELLTIIEREGPLTIQLMKEMTGWRVKDITPILHRLQEAFLIYEDQNDGEWDRGWYRFEEMFPNVNLEKYTRVEALKIILQRFAYRMVWFDLPMAKSFYKLPVKDIKAAVTELVNERILVTWEGGYLLKTDTELLEKEGLPAGCKGADTQAACAVYTPPKQVRILHRNDILVKTEEHIIKEKYKSGYELLQLILIDGEIHGAVQGKFKYGPYIIEDIVVDKGYEERKEEIIEKVQLENPGSNILRFMGA